MTALLNIRKFVYAHLTVTAPHQGLYEITRPLRRVVGDRSRWGWGGGTVVADGSPVCAGTSTRWSSRSVVGDTGYGGRSMTKARCSTFWYSRNAALTRRGDCFESCCISRVMRRSASPQTSSSPTLLPFVRNGCLRPTIRDCARIIGRIIPMSARREGH